MILRGDPLSEFKLVASLARAKSADAPAWKLSLNVPLEIDA